MVLVADTFVLVEGLVALLTFCDCKHRPTLTLTAPPAILGHLLDSWAYHGTLPILIVLLIEVLVLCTLQCKFGPAFVWLKEYAILPLGSNQCMGCIP